MALPQANHKQYKSFIALMMITRQPIMAVGEPGVGKTWAPIEYCKDNDIDIIISHPSIDMPQDYKGMAAKGKALVPSTAPRAPEDDDDLMSLLGEAKPDMVEIDIATFLPFDQMLKALSATKPTIWFFDDYGQGTPAVQSATMQLFGSRELGGKKLPDCVYLMAATNGTQHRANVHGILEPVKSRFGMIFELLADYNGFMENFAPRNKIYPTIQLFLGYMKDAFCKFNPKSGMENSPNPRLWHKLSDQLYGADKMQLDEDSRRIVVSGCVGSTYGVKYSEFEKVQKELPTLSEILVDPENYPINQPLNIRYAMLGMIATQAKPHQAEDVFTYVSKMAKEYQMIFFNLVQQYNEELADTSPAQKWWAANLDLAI